MLRAAMIAGVLVDPPFVLAPLAGYTDSPMRRLCRRYGAALVWTEMVSAEAIVHNVAKALALLRFHPSERPIVFQLFGTRPESMGRAAATVAKLGPDLIDMNFGCPARKIVRSGGGAALMGDVARLREIARAVVEATTIPVTAKLRSGPTDDMKNAVQVAAALEEDGIRAVVVHPRTCAQRFTGRADWSIIRAVKGAVAVPVIGSGDVREPADALRMLEETGCDAVMIGRTAVGRPWIFSQLGTYAATGTVPPPPPFPEIVRACIEHLDLMVESKGEPRGVREMRKHIVLYLRGFPHASTLRSELVRIERYEVVRERLSDALAGAFTGTAPTAPEGAIGEGA
jgi:tRNA-dihydrouridine synthase B